MTCVQTTAAVVFTLGSTFLTCAKKACNATYDSLQEPRFMSPNLHEQRARAQQGLHTVMFGSIATVVPADAFRERDLAAVHRLVEELTVALTPKCPSCRKPFVRNERCPQVTTDCLSFQCRLPSRSDKLTLPSMLTDDGHQLQAPLLLQTSLPPSSHATDDG